MTEIPVIDVAGVISGSPGALEDLRSAYADHGFAYITGHGISPDLIGGVFEASRRFHALPQAEKMGSSRAKPMAHGLSAGAGVADARWQSAAALAGQLHEFILRAKGPAAVADAVEEAGCAAAAARKKRRAGSAPD